MLTKQQLDGLVKVGAIKRLDYNWNQELVGVYVEITSGYWKKLRFKRTSDMILLTAHLKRFTIQKAKERKYCKAFEERTSIYEQEPQLKISKYGDEDRQFFDGIWAVDATGGVKIADNWVNACIAVSEGGQ